MCMFGKAKETFSYIWGETVILYNQDSTIQYKEVKEALGLQGCKRVENIQLGLPRAEDIQNSTRRSI